jgi:tetratricopeptide (TPR) repeat protein
MLADLYIAKRDYENALANYTNSIVTLDFRDKDRDKSQTLIGIGDIMKIRGNNFEAINYYKYALGIGKLKQKAYIKLLLKLSDAYYDYGNYLNGLKFAAMASRMSKKINNGLLYSNSKYFECLNYEYLGEQEMAKKACAVAIEEAEKYKNEVSDYQSYMNLAYMLDFSSYSRNPKLAIQYLETAGRLVENSSDVYKKVDVMEKLASIKAYSNPLESKCEVLEIYDKLNRIYKENNLKIGCCNSLLSGLIREQSGMMADAENSYFKAEEELRNKRQQLSILYTYMSDFYEHQGMKQKAMLYAKKALDIEFQIYRFDHHYIKYTIDKIDHLRKSLDE